MSRNCSQSEVFRQEHPYSVMLQSYRAALDAVLQRLTELRRESRDLPPEDGFRRAASDRCQLEKRIDLLRREAFELTDVIRMIRPYAEREEA